MISLGGAIGVGLLGAFYIKWTGPSVCWRMPLLVNLVYCDAGAWGDGYISGMSRLQLLSMFTSWLHRQVGERLRIHCVGMSEVVAATEYLKYWWPHAHLDCQIVIIVFLV